MVGRSPGASSRSARRCCRWTQGSLYPALHRLEQQGWLKAQKGVTDTGREAKFYALTAAGRKQLARELETWDRLSGAVGLVVRESGEA